MHLVRPTERFVKFRNYKVVYRRYAGLFFCVCVDANDNELAYLEAIHLFVEVLGESLRRFDPVGTRLIVTSLSRRVLRERLRVGSRVQLLQGAFAKLCTHRSLDKNGLFRNLPLPQVYAILDEIFLAGEIEETSKDVVLGRLDELEKLE